MAIMDGLIKLRKDGSLRERIQAEAKFGPVFENHVPDFEKDKAHA